MRTITKILGLLCLVFVFALSAVASPKPDVKTKTPVTNATKATTTVHNEAASDWQHTTGEVVSADIADNTLLLKSNGKDLRFSVPGRISMLELKPGDEVSVSYLAEGNHLRVWEMKRD